jgi:ribosomal-protein-alanine N-acetyltransferase
MLQDIDIRPMDKRDVDHVAYIEKKCFNCPWTKGTFIGEICNNKLAYYFVVTLGQKVIGYAGTWTILDEAHVTTIAVHPDFRGKGLGKRLVITLMLHTIKMGIPRITLEVRASNITARKLYQGLGFLEHGVRKGYYCDNHEDAIIMWRELGKNNVDPGN